MEMIKDYHCNIAYHLRKANVVAEVLSRKNLSKKNRGKIALLQELKTQRVDLSLRTMRNLSAQFRIRQTVKDEILKTQPEDLVLRSLSEGVRKAKMRF